MQHNKKESESHFNEHAVGLFIKAASRDGKKTLVGAHMPIELSSLTDHFLKADKSNCGRPEVTGKRKCEVGLVVPANFSVCTLNKRYAQVMGAELITKNDKHKHLELLREPGFESFPKTKLKDFLNRQSHV